MRMKSLRFYPLTVAIILLLAVSTSYATTSLPMNGDFSSDLDYWTFEGDVQAVNQEAVLGDNGSFYSALYQGVALAQGTYSINFDFQSRLSDSVPDFTFPDTVFNSIYFIDDMSMFDPYYPTFDDAITMFNVDYMGIFDNSGNLSTSEKGNDWTHFSMTFTNMHAYVIPTFELLDGNFIDNDSTFLIDNVSLKPVPEPATLLLLATGLLGLGGAVRRKRK